MQQNIILIAEHFSRDARGCMEVLRVLVTDREENHADSITHIGLAAAAVTAAFLAMAGTPSVVTVGHFEEIAGVD